MSKCPINCVSINPYNTYAHEHMKFYLAYHAARGYEIDSRNGEMVLEVKNAGGKKFITEAERISDGRVVDLVLEDGQEIEVVNTHEDGERYKREKVTVIRV